MLILGQDKDLLTDNLNLIIEETTFKEIGKVYVIQNEIYKIGYYATEERAKEVLQEIIECYGSYLQLSGGPAIIQGQMDIQPNIFNIPKVYKMPEK